MDQESSHGDEPTCTNLIHCSNEQEDILEPDH